MKNNEWDLSKAVHDTMIAIEANPSQVRLKDNSKDYLAFEHHELRKILYDFKVDVLSSQKAEIIEMVRGLSLEQGTRAIGDHAIFMMDKHPILRNSDIARSGYEIALDDLIAKLEDK